MSALRECVCVLTVEERKCLHSESVCVCVLTVEERKCLHSESVCVYSLLKRESVCLYSESVCVLTVVGLVLSSFSQHSVDRPNLEVRITVSILQYPRHMKVHLINIFSLIGCQPL